MDYANISNRLTAVGAALPPPVSGEPSVTPFDAIYNGYAPLLRRIAMRKFGISRGDVDGLVHDVFATYLANPDNVRNLHAYLIGAICNASRQHLRRDSSERRMFCDKPVCAATPDDALIDEVIRNSIIRATLAELGPSCRDALQRFYLNGETAPAIARNRNTTANYIRRLLHLCRSRARVIYTSRSRRLHE
jgi:RNA polymerase sigma factor (sigma-70 family)